MCAHVDINEPGDLDPSFGVGGIAALDHIAGPARCLGLQLAGDGGVLVLSDNLEEGFWLSKLTAQGALDTRFANGNGALFDGTLRSRSAALHMWNDRPTVIAAQSSQLMIKRYQPDGLPDQSFGQDGVVSVPLGNDIPAFSGKLTTAEYGDYWYVAFSARWLGTQVMTAVLRLNQNGSLDKNFNKTGFTVIDLAGMAPNQNMPIDLKVQHHGSNAGKLLVLLDRRLALTDRYDNFILRLNHDGSRDFQFAAPPDGLVALAYNDFARTNQLVVDGTDTFKVLGMRAGDEADCSGLGFTADGAIDPGFNNGALWLTPVGYSQHKTGWYGGLAWGEQDRYRLLTWGMYSDRFIAHQFQISRVNQRCEPDADFGDEGISQFDLSLQPGFGEARPNTVRSPLGDYYLGYGDKVIKVLG